MTTETQVASTNPLLKDPHLLAIATLLALYGEASLEEVSRFLTESASTVCSLLDRLVKLGLVEQIVKSCTESEHTQHVYKLTSKGREVLVETLRVLSEKVSKALRVVREGSTHHS